MCAYKQCYIKRWHHTDTTLSIVVGLNCSYVISMSCSYAWELGVLKQSFSICVCGSVHYGYSVLGSSFHTLLLTASHTVLSVNSILMNTVSVLVSVKCFAICNRHMPNGHTSLAGTSTSNRFHASHRLWQHFLLCRVSCSTPEWNAITWWHIGLVWLVMVWGLPCQRLVILFGWHCITPRMATFSLFMSQVINWSGRPVGNGVNYPVREGCSKFDFTVEQIEQKKKMTRMVSVSLCLCLCIYMCV